MQFVEVGVPHEIVQTPYACQCRYHLLLHVGFTWLCTIHPYKYFSPSIV